MLFHTYGPANAKPQLLISLFDNVTERNVVSLDDRDTHLGLDRVEVDRVDECTTLNV